MQGVVRTAVGYAGGSSANPTYYDLGTHAECLEVQFDPTRLSYPALLDLFWQGHRPTRSMGSSQYRSAIFATTTEQLELAVTSKQTAEARAGARLFTEIAPLPRFYLAEDYHQKYAMRKLPLAAAELGEMYPALEQLVASTAATRVNAYAKGHGSREQFEAELGSLGLSETAQAELVARWRSFR